MRLLLVSYAFPPVGGAGVQRVLKLAKYLPAHGVEPVILTASNPSVPVVDTTLIGDVPEGARVVRTRTLEPGYEVKRAAWRASAADPTPRARLLRRAVAAGRALLVPDPQILWLPTALPAVLRLAREVDALLVSGPPFSQFLVGPAARAARIPVALDYRDEWGTALGYEMHGGRLARAAARALEPALLRTAALVITATETFRENLLERHRFLDPARVVTIPNGYDPEDFAPLPPDLAPPSDRYVVTYAGTVFRLTSARGLLDGVRWLNERHPDLARHLELRFIGRVVETELPPFDGTERLGVRRLGYLPHLETLLALARSHLNLCLLDDVPGAASIYPAKIFELMRLGRACLTLAPPGALARLVEEHRLGEVVHPRDAKGIGRALAERLSAWRRGELPLLAPVRGVERFDRRALAGELAQAMRRVVA